MSAILPRVALGSTKGALAGLTERPSFWGAARVALQLGAA